MRPLRIVRMRRDYNRWAADQSLEDYALRFTARSARAATPLRAALTALGSISFLALEAIGGTLTMAFGFTNTALAIAFVSVVIFLVSLPICATAARSGLDIDLLTRGTGFGYIGSTLTSLIYASFTFIFFGIEAAILAALLEQIPGISHTIACCLAALLVIPLVTGGFRFIARFQIFSLPIWFALNLIPLIAILYAHPNWIGDWVQFKGLAATQPVNIFAIGSAASIMFVLICQSAEQVDFLRTIRESGEHMTGLLTGLLDISKIEAGRIELYSDRIILGQFLNTVVQMVRPQARAKRLDFHYHPGYLPPVVMGDEHRLRQILLNLLSNAVKFTPSGSVTFTANWRGQIAEFIIEDTGPGIAPADQERIFEPFERAAGDAVPGTGLGLTITRLLTHILGGELTLTSEVGHGTRFRVRLLLSDRAEDATPVLQGLPSGYGGARKTILVVDDNAAHRRMMHEFLGSRHFNVRDVSGGVECLEFLKTELPDLIILDLSMPGMDGRELALRIRETSAGHLPLLFLTGNVTELASRRVPSLDDCTVLAKPVDFQALLDEIGRLLDLQWVFSSDDEALSDETLQTLTSEDEPAHSPDDMQPDLLSDISLTEDAKTDLLELINSGNVRLLRQKLDLLCNSHPHLVMTLAPIQEAARTYQLETVRRLLEELPA
nr:ATP-binding protein [Acetobacter sp. UBA5411]